LNDPTTQRGYEGKRGTWPTIGVTSGPGGGAPKIVDSEPLHGSGSGIKTSQQCCCHWHNIGSRLACAENSIAFVGWIDRFKEYRCIIFKKFQERAAPMAVKRESWTFCRFSYNKVSTVEHDSYLMWIKSSLVVTDTITRWQ
jgi:hypothetical protein